ALFAVVLVALRSWNTEKLLAAFLAGSLLTTIGIGLAIVSPLDDSSIVASHTRRSAGPVADLVVGVLAVLLGLFLARRPALAPARTTALVDRLNAWFDHNGRRVAVVALELGGAYLIVRGSIALI